LYALLFIVQTIIFHASKVITPELLLKRWFAAASLLIVTTGVWLFVRNKQNGPAMYRFLLGLLILADIAFAAFNVYTQRGYASKSVLLFLIPIIVASALLSRAALMATAIVAVAVYSTTAISYFVLNFNEGYMSELYAEVGFYSGIFLLTAGLLWSTVKKHR
jgi:hypothetical protein